MATVISGCAGSMSSSNNDGRLQVVATTTQLGDFVRAVGGTAVDVHQILQPNSDPHDYEPRPSDVTATSTAKLVFLSGNRLDQWMTKVIGEAGGKPTVVTLAPTFTPDRIPGESAGPAASAFDPHWWHDPRNAEAAVAAIRDALANADPSAAAQLTQNANDYLDKLHTLDAGIANCFKPIPFAARKLVTSHDAFGYFARRYGIAVVGAVIPSQSTQAQPSAGQISALATLIRREHVRAIYPESSINAKLADALGRETGAHSDLTLYGDTLGPKGAPGATYLTMEQANADAMVNGFTGGKRRCRIAGL
jgi:zinc/manganese transport system substrate-binding protein